MNAPQKSGMSNSLCVCRHQIVLLIREIDVARSKRAQYIFYEFKSVVRTAVFDDNLQRRLAQGWVCDVNGFLTRG